MYKRIEVDNLEEIQNELIQYDFFKKFVTHGDWGTTGNSHSNFDPLSTSAAYFKDIPDLKKLKIFLESTVETKLISHFYIMNFEGNFSSDIHLDVDSTWSLNIPIFNCQESSTIFYDDSKNEIDRITLDTPYFLKVGKIYHQIVNHSNKTRLVMSIRFTSDNLEEIVK